MLEYALMPLKRYAEFSGRSRRKEYWFFLLGVVIAAIVLSIIEKIVGLPIILGPYGPLTSLLLIAVIIPSIAVQVRRFHDQDKSGWFVLLSLIPFLGGLVVLVFMFLEGTRGPNRFGPDPKDPGTVATFA
ncbi:MAG: DUF805 domain-containing protein [Novosphingobium sp.]